MSRHCRKFGYKDGYCGMLACARCGKRAMAVLRQRIVRAMRKRGNLWFVTIYYYASLETEGLPIFAAFTNRQMESVMRQAINRLLRALRDKARRDNQEFEYIAVIAFGEFRHRVHARVHTHIVCTWLPDALPMQSRRTTRYSVPFLDFRLRDLKMMAWVEKVQNSDAVARYMAQNAESAVGKSELAKVKVYRFSEGFEK